MDRRGGTSDDRVIRPIHPVFAEKVSGSTVRPILSVEALT
jgi:hypothetical protein